LTIIWQLTELLNLTDMHVCIADDVGGFVIGKSGLLNFSGGLYTFTHAFGWLPNSITAQLLIVHAWDFDAAAPCQYDPTLDPRCAFDIW
jgi:hypothetical protein